MKREYDVLTEQLSETRADLKNFKAMRASLNEMIDRLEEHRVELCQRLEAVIEKEGR